MESQIWVKSEEKWAYILILRGPEVSLLKVTGNMLTLKRNLTGVVEKLQQGQEPATVGAKLVESFAVGSITKAQVSPGNASLTLHGGPDGSKSLTFSPPENDADAILQTILAQAGRAFAPKEEEIGVIEALIPPAIVGAVGGGLWFAVYDAAGKMAAGEAVEVQGLRKRGMKRILLTVAETLGTNGTIAVGVVLLLLVLGWATMQIVRRPRRTVWLPESA